MLVEEKILDLSRYNGAVTVKNPKTDGHRTFRIWTVKNGGLAGSRLVGLLTGSDNEVDYRAFGFVSSEGQVILWKKYAGTDFEKFSKILNQPEWFSQNYGLSYQFAVRCRKCNRELTDPESISTGLGPICREQM